MLLVIKQIVLISLMHEMGVDRCSFSSCHFIFFSCPVGRYTLCHFRLCNHGDEIRIMGQVSLGVKIIKVEIAFVNQPAHALRFDDFVVSTFVQVLKIDVALVDQPSYTFRLDYFVMRSLHHNIVVSSLCLEPICILKVLNLALL